MSGLTQAGKINWYDSINKSALTPPGVVFSIAWIILYIMLAIYAWWLWQKSELKLAKILFAIQMVLNWLWTPLFFSFHLTGLALTFILAMIILTTLVFSLSKKQKAQMALLLLPYLTWLCFACYLNGYIWLYN